MAQLSYSEPWWGELAFGRDGAVEGRIFCYFDWRDDALSLQPYLLTKSATAYFCEQGLDPDETIRAKLEGDKLTFTGKWAEIIGEPLSRQPDFDLSVP